MRWLLAAGFLAGCADVELEPLSLLDPHPIPRNGGFEGWYLRLRDVTGERSLGAIFGSVFPRGGGDGFPGYAAMLLQEKGAEPLRVFDSHSASSRISINGRVPRAMPSAMGAPEFEWRDEHGNWLSELGFHLRQGERQLSVELTEQERPWGVSGPESWIRAVPVVPLHWFVHSLNTLGRYTLRTGGREVSGSAWVHVEKNWGKAFPRKWIWGQGFSADGTTQYAFAGGETEVLGVPFTAWFWGIFRGDEEWIFTSHTPGHVFESDPEPCAGRFRLRAKGLWLHAELRTSAPAASFSALSVPTAQGFRAEAVETFQARTEIVLRGARRSEAQEVFRFEDAALEFGGSERCGVGGE